MAQPSKITTSDAINTKKHYNLKKENNKKTLFQYGIANAFIEGNYEGDLTIEDLKKKGNFGIGAPELIDGELTIVDGQAYQSTAKGKTFEPQASLRTPFAFVTTFRADSLTELSDIQNINDLFTRISKVLPNPNGIYALRIKGVFSTIKTRAFPPVVHKPFKPLAQMLDQQHFFEFKDISGELIGFYIPGYLSAINITGPHFHFLSENRGAGGHLVGISAKKLTIELCEVDEFHLQLPNTKDFAGQKFQGKNTPSLQRIEKGYD